MLESENDILRIFKQFTELEEVRLKALARSDTEINWLIMKQTAIFNAMFETVPGFAESFRDNMQRLLEAYGSDCPAEVEEKAKRMIGTFDSGQLRPDWFRGVIAGGKSESSIDRDEEPTLF